MTKEFSNNGNEIIRSFSMAGCSGREYDLMQLFINKGFTLLYCDASYYWGLINPRTRTIITYTEGDITKIICKTRKSFIQELYDYILFFNGYDKGLLKETRENLKDLGLCEKKNPNLSLSKIRKRKL